MANLKFKDTSSHSNHKIDYALDATYESKQKHSNERIDVTSGYIVTSYDQEFVFYSENEKKQSETRDINKKLSAWKKL